MRPSAAVARGARTLGSSAEARTLLAHMLGVEPARLPFVGDVTDADLAALDALVARRLAGEPVQHLTGRAHFRSVEVAVGPGVFIPRPETELLAGWGLDFLRTLPGRPLVVELCAGSGAVVKALATEWPDADYHAVELSADAFGYLERNLAGTDVHAVHADMAGALRELDGTVDLVLANPPYVPTTARADLPTDVLHDPDAALFSGVDGLDALRVVADVAGRLLRPGGRVGAEHDDTQGTAAPQLFAARGFDEVCDHLDLAGRPRFVTARASARVPGRMAP